MTPHAEWRTVRLADLVADPRNARAHGARNAEVVRSSLAEFGQVESLVVQAGTGRVLGGNLRLVELLAAGEVEAFACVVDVQGPVADRLALILNRSAELATWDSDNLSAILRDLDAAGDPLAGLGWDGFEIARICGPSASVSWNDAANNGGADGGGSIGGGSDRAKPVRGSTDPDLRSARWLPEGAQETAVLNVSLSLADRARVLVLLERVRKDLGDEATAGAALIALCDHYEQTA